MEDTHIINDSEGESSDSGGDFGDFMKSIEESMVHMMKESANAPQTAMEHWNAFSSAVDWSENWIRSLLVFHVVLLLIVVATRKNLDLQTLFFAAICLLVFCSEFLNSYCAQNWASFSKQNYFDSHGVFAGIMYSGPLLLIGLFQLVSNLQLTAQLQIFLFFTFHKLYHLVFECVCRS